MNTLNSPHLQQMSYTLHSEQNKNFKKNFLMFLPPRFCSYWIAVISITFPFSQYFLSIDYEPEIVLRSRNRLMIIQTCSLAPWRQKEEKQISEII